MEALFSSLLTGPALAAYGPWGIVAIIMVYMFFTWHRGREARLAQINDRERESLREDQRALFERQTEEIEGLRVDKTTLETRLRATEALASDLRQRLFSQYLDWRDSYHAANNARAVLVAANLKRPEDYEPLKRPEPPIG
ncbi:hypothetical protein GXW78_25640 [Roseomonas terrae]|uniref:Uncharacterized protein n=1 Tax=Neoroseomonas terrae TaxID=424799 RepID=A0ABS5EPU8_9PROT|nr:hypothetical protein [Neoroseomonas terrae]MBR0653065.1 hypothetical protein [Neoroseomonas terrae]